MKEDERKKYNALETILGVPRRRPVEFDRLIPNRIQNILLVSSLYDSFTFVEDGRITDLLFTEYLHLNLRYAPRVNRVSTASKALKLLETERYDLVISMLRIGDISIREFGQKVQQLRKGIPVLLLAFNAREISMIEEMESLPGIERIFVWNGDATLFLAMAKYAEDRLNAWHDAHAAGVQSIILIEDSVRFYSSYLPMLYTEIMSQTQALMADGLNQMQKLNRQHARPKILLASNWEEAYDLYQNYQDDLLGVIADVAFPREGRIDPNAGLNFVKMVKDEQPSMAVLVQSSDEDNRALAEGIGAAFINKRSPSLLHDVRDFMRDHLGFGDFVFRRPDNSVITTASDLRSMAEALRLIPEESFIHHCKRKDFSTWLMARTEFDLAKTIRQSRLATFPSAEEFRRFLIEALETHRDRTRAGIVSEFSSGTFEGKSGFVRIGKGSLGGKGRGLAFVNALFESYRIDERMPDMDLFVPPTVVLATDIFDQFVESAGLIPYAIDADSDQAVVEAVCRARFPEEVIEQLRVFLSRVRYPLAVRSSSLLEDASFQPFAGIYRTYMIPNNHDNPDNRLSELLNAIKFVYASTYFKEAKSYLANTPSRLEEEKMAVIIQQVVGRRHGDLVYPDVAGVARSYNFYPVGDFKPEDGVISTVLGLGKSVVDGGRCLRFIPSDPAAFFGLMTPRDYLNNSQRDFLALDLSNPGPHWDDCRDLGSNVRKVGLDVAVAHGTFDRLGSVYSHQGGTIQHGVAGPGAKLITLAGLLGDPRFRFAEGLSFLLQVGSAGLSCPVEIEFAVNIREDQSPPLEFGFLQIRPMVIDPGVADIDLATLRQQDALCVSRLALGHGQFEDIRDVVYVREDNFNRALTREIAEEVADINQRLRDSGRRYVLIGPGRWGSADWRLGIPVLWSQISNVSCIVETDLKDIRVSPSQGSHFFQNITSSGAGYFTIRSEDPSDCLDMEWLDRNAASFATEHVRLVSFDAPLDIAVDSRSRVGVIMKAGLRAPRSVD